MGQQRPGLITLHKCCGPALAATERNDAYRIDGVVYFPDGLHRGSHQTWECLKSAETGEHKDVCTYHFDAGLQTGKIKIVPAMEALAWAARHC